MNRTDLTVPGRAISYSAHKHMTSTLYLSDPEAILRVTSPALFRSSTDRDMMKSLRERRFVNLLPPKENPKTSQKVQHVAPYLFTPQSSSPTLPKSPIPSKMIAENAQIKNSQMNASTLHDPTALLKYQCINHMPLPPALSVKCFPILENFSEICNLHLSLTCDLEGNISRQSSKTPVLLH